MELREYNKIKYTLSVQNQINKTKIKIFKIRTNHFVHFIFMELQNYNKIKYTST